MTMSTTELEKAFIRDQIAALGATRVLEVGAFKGETTRVITDALPPGGMVVVIDPMTWGAEAVLNGVARHVSGTYRPLLTRILSLVPRWSYEAEFWATIGASARDQVQLFRQLSTDAELIANPDPRLAEFDLAFIDGDHSFEGAKADLENWGSRVRPGGRVLIHDAVDAFPGVCEAIRAWGSDPSVRVSHGRHGSICAIERVHPFGVAAPRATKGVERHAQGVLIHGSVEPRKGAATGT